MIDYGLGNIFSIRSALRDAGADDLVVSNDPEVVLRSDSIIVPGVGAFEDGVKGLTGNGMAQALSDKVYEGIPILCICVGMQVLADKGEEFGDHQGLGFIGGTVKKIDANFNSSERFKIPFLGWKRLEINQNNPSSKLFDGIGSSD